MPTSRTNLPPMFPMQPQPLRVLIVDDEPTYVGSLSAILSGHPGLRVAACALDGREGVERARVVRPDVVVVNVNMPRLDGFATAREIRRELPAARIVIVSGAPERDHPARAREAGADLYLPKDVDFRTLTDVVAERPEHEGPDTNRVATTAATA